MPRCLYPHCPSALNHPRCEEALFAPGENIKKYPPSCYPLQESGFYYLKSRYFDPAICRFINADGLASTGHGFLGCNMFAYCNNNPVNMVDKNGRDAGTLAAEWGVSMWWLTLIDGPLPFGDFLYYGGLVLLGGFSLIGLSYLDYNLPIVYATEEPDTPDVEYGTGDGSKPLKNSCFWARASPIPGQLGYSERKSFKLAPKQRG